MIERVRVSGRGVGLKFTEMFVLVETDAAYRFTPFAPIEDHEKNAQWVAKSLMLWGDTLQQGDTGTIVVPEWFEREGKYAKWFEGRTVGGGVR